MDGSNGRGIEQVVFHTGYGKVMFEILLHILSADTFQVAPGDDSGSQGLRGAIHELIDEVGLSCQDDR